MTDKSSLSNNSASSASAIEKIVVLDYGSQYSRLITRRVRELGVYCELVNYDCDTKVLKDENVKGIVLSGGPESVFEDGAPGASKGVDEWVKASGVPVLGICYGMHLLAQLFGGEVIKSGKSEFGKTELKLEVKSDLFLGVPDMSQVWMSHQDSVTKMPKGFSKIASSQTSTPASEGVRNYAGFANKEKRVYGIQFHPEVSHTSYGMEIISNFVKEVCGAKASWGAGDFIKDAYTKIQSTVKDSQVICAVSGGVDSTVTATLLARSIGNQLNAVFVDNGLLRRGETARIKTFFKENLKLPLNVVDASDLFLENLKGVVDPEKKRKVIGKTFIDVFENFLENAGKSETTHFLAQGTTYPDVIESYNKNSKASHKIKTHHNVGGLPERMRLKVLEPIRLLFKDEVRKVGIELGVPKQLVNRQPFPGPGLAVRIMGEVTKDKLEVLRACDWIVVDEIKRFGFYNKTWQCFAVLTSQSSVGVVGDRRAYGSVVAVRVVTSDDAMTADWARLPYEVIEAISSRISNEVESVNRVVYDVTSKPPGTIEWE